MKRCQKISKKKWQMSIEDEPFSAAFDKFCSSSLTKQRHAGCGF